MQRLILLWLSSGFLLSIIALIGCTRVHHVHIGAIDHTQRGLPIEVVIDSIGVDAAQVARTVESITQRGQKKSDKLSDTIALFQMGPKTGAPVYDPHWGERLMRELHQKCPSAKLRNIHTQRLSTDYGNTGTTRELLIVRALCIRDL